VTTVAAIAERWWFSLGWGEAGSLTSAFYYGDAPRLVDYAVAILNGQSFDNGIPYHPPGWPTVLAVFMRLLGGAQTSGAVPVAAVKLLLAVLSGVTVGLTTLLAYEISGAGAMVAVGLLGAFHFGHIVEGAVANSEALHGLCVAVAMWAAWRWLREARGRSLPYAVCAGAVCGIAMLVRAEFLAAAVLLLAEAAWWRRPGWQAETAAFLLTLCVVLTPATWWHWKTLSAFNASHAGRVAGPLSPFAPVTSYGPFNFAMANHALADGGPNRDHPLLDRCDQETDAALSAGQLDLACPAVYDLYVHGYAIGVAWLVENPAAAMQLMGRKVWLGLGFLAHGYLIDDLGSGVNGTRRRVDLVDPDNWWLVPIHLFLFAAGLFALRSRPVAIGVVIAPLAALAGATLLFYGYVRLGVAYMPAVWIAQGAALGAVLDRLSSTRGASRSIVGAGIAAIVLICVVEGVGARTRRLLTMEGARTPGGALVQDETLRVRRVP